MSASATPITFTRFSQALSDLSVESLYAKYSEITNQLAHLESSNKQLEEFARDNDDRDCYEALLENRVVMKRFEERREAIVNEVSIVRGLPWRVRDEEEEKKKKVRVEGGAALNGTNANGMTAAAEQTNGGAAQGDGDDGVYL
ncbi:hypothetical protein CFE70_001848 [Pyrenophora teres f. teres 0-1]|uniref:Uncharacterized protein n=2 Tax=Pyrenophora teres f. teres TaxID=97479 RepID=E3RRR0_PYRTT|nr:hypothetical protein PTT_11525 [Pyrenophora teres f. teres 0-1]KAE8842410.1 hypothetical protein HRS9139_01707 [Pyrenophora teres f. teres]KAE8850527.1 hypothetical protein PTNB85_00943 [Pyrenophora teres f. teres]KAE8851448.1 hypothetical protein HRS9122_01735 [Pyrenophora teres f. teres]KAE8870111.1 hypothetical protein PTNB29_00455 [Pyrenophora teres f. teres]